MGKSALNGVTPGSQPPPPNWFTGPSIGAQRRRRRRRRRQGPGARYVARGWWVVFPPVSRYIGRQASLPALHGSAVPVSGNWEPRGDSGSLVPPLIPNLSCYNTTSRAHGDLPKLSWNCQGRRLLKLLKERHRTSQSNQDLQGTTKLIESHRSSESYRNSYGSQEALPHRATEAYRQLPTSRTTAVKVPREFSRDAE